MADADRMADRYAVAAGTHRARLVRRIVAAGGLRDPAWREAFETVPRHVFVPAYYRPRHSGGYDRLSCDDPDPRHRAGWLAGAYADEPLATHLQDGQPLSSSSQPSLMAAMAEALRVREGQTVLEIGTGTGYNAALLAHRLGGGAVTSIDLDPEIAEAARAHLAVAGLRTAVITGDGALGCADRAPYDRIIATCELPAVPAAWLRQCRPGARILAPLAGGLIMLRVAGAAHAQGRFLDASAHFVSLRGAAAGAHPLPDAVGSEERVRATATPPRVLQSDVFRFLLTLFAGELEVRWAFGGRGACVTASDGSAARADREGTVLLTGPRDLWSLVERAYELWQRESRPSRDRFGLTIDDTRQWAWLDDPAGPHTWRITPGGA